jgi:hypothetical protein
LFSHQQVGSLKNEHQLKIIRLLLIRQADNSVILKITTAWPISHSRIFSDRALYLQMGYWKQAQAECPVHAEGRYPEGIAQSS